MTDQCQHCRIKGDLKKCKETECFHRESWYAVEQQNKIEALQDFAIWMTGCGYDFAQHDYFFEQRDKLLKDYVQNASEEPEAI